MKLGKNSIRVGGTALLTGALIVGGFLGGTWLLQTVQFAHAQQQVETTREQLAQVEDLASVFRQVNQSIEASVVNIRVEKQVRGPQMMPFDDDMLRRFFPDEDGDGKPDLPERFGNRRGDTYRQEGTGSGVIMDVENGSAYILTNNHVAGDASKLVVTLNDGRKIDNGTVVGADAKSDLAVVKIDVDRVIAAPWGNSDELQKGDWILAFGSPFGFVGSMTHGIVSAINRDHVGILGADGYENFIQVDAPINPGNSGGPLVNIHGQVVGINTAIASRSGGFQGIGFAIPSNQARQVYNQLRAKGKVTRGWLGVSIRDIASAPELAESFGYTGKTGVLVEQILPNAPAGQTLEAGDIITQLDGKPIANIRSLRSAIALTPPGQEVSMTIFRNGQEQVVSVKLGEQPEDVMALARRGYQPSSPGAHQAAANQLGIALADVNPSTVQRYELQDITQGAVITEVQPDSPAAEAGLQPGDVISRVDRQQVSDAAGAYDALKDVKLTDGVRLYVQGREGARFVFIKTAAK